jgi:hypothetical protein
MKTLIASLIALGLLSGAASAEWCAPGYGYRTGHSVHRPTFSAMPKVIAEAPAPAVAAPAPEAAAPEAPAPAPEALPPK